MSSIGQVGIDGNGNITEVIVDKEITTTAREAVIPCSLRLDEGGKYVEEYRKEDYEQANICSGSLLIRDSDIKFMDGALLVIAQCNECNHMFIAKIDTSRTLEVID